MRHKMAENTKFSIIVVVLGEHEQLYILQPIQRVFSPYVN